MKNISEKLSKNLFKPIPIDSIVLFRISFGIIIAYHFFKYVYYNLIEVMFIQPQFHFTYYGFDWVKAVSSEGFYIIFGVSFIAALFVAFGLFYRASIITLLLGFSYFFLVEATNYNNHYYFIILLAFLMIFIPAHKKFSIDVLRKPKIKSDFIPAWCLWILLFQIGIVYFFGGVAKINWDWLMEGEPLRTWLGWKQDLFLIGPFLKTEFGVYFFSWAGMLYDLLVTPLLLWKPTRKYAFVATGMFHGLNSQLFQIGVFPPLMFLATTLFFEPDWPKKLIYKIKIKKEFESEKIEFKINKPIIVFLSIYCLIQILAPLRHFLYPGDVTWTREGHLFAWQMKLNHRYNMLLYKVSDLSTGKEYIIDPTNYLNWDQYNEFSSDPDMLLQFAYEIGKILNKNNLDNIVVNLDAFTSINQKPMTRFVNKNTNLLDEPRSLLPKKWLYTNLTSPEVLPPQNQVHLHRDFNQSIAPGK